MSAPFFRCNCALVWINILLVCAGTPPCPEDATVQSCAQWCKEAVPDGHGTLGGSSCARLSAQEIQAGRGPSCTCYDKNYERELATCTSKCPIDEDEESANENDAMDDEAGCFGTDGRDTCRADQIPVSGPYRYLLYDVKQGEGFNLQREIFPRVGWVVAQLNEAILRDCGSHSAGRCAEWVLVLPPWCMLAHWRLATKEHVPWQRFFDSRALLSPGIKIIEFQEFVANVGGPKVDLVVSSTTRRLSKNQIQTKPKRSGGFYGFANNHDLCFEDRPGSLPPPQQEWLHEAERWKVTYSGRCDGGVLAIDHVCATLAESSGQDFVDLLLAAGRQNVRSILVKAADSVSPPGNEALDALSLRESMLYASPIRQAGERYMARVMASRPFLAVHCRRTDFLHARKKTTPGPEAIGAQIAAALTEFGFNQVFVATDAPDELRDVLRSSVKQGSVRFLQDDPDLASVYGKGGGQEWHEGELALIEMWIAARATAFIGTQESRFTMHIQLERSWLGKKTKLSITEFCKEFNGTPCKSPYWRSSERKGVHHADYWEPSS